MARISFQFKLHSFIFFVLFISIIFTTSLALYYGNIKENLEETKRVLKSRDIVDHIPIIEKQEKSVAKASILIIISGSIVALSAFYVLFNYRGKSLSKYHRILDRLNIETSNMFNLNVKFPPDDEFGNLGTRLNKLINQLQTFDKIKQKKYVLERVKANELIELIPFPVYVMDEKYEYERYNQALLEEFELTEKTFDASEFDELLAFARKKSDLFSRGVQHIDFPEKIKVKENCYQVEFKVIPVLRRDGDKEMYCLIFYMTSVQKINKKRKKDK